MKQSEMESQKVNQSGKLEIAKKMLERKIEIDVIMNVTGLSEEEIKKLQTNE